VLSAPSFSAENASKTYYGSNSEPTLTEQTSTRNFTRAELEQMLAPIALYPDTLLTHILIATTYPIEVVDAERWLNKNSQLSAQSLADAAENQDWDASIKALLPFPNVLKKLSEDLHWMRNLGDAFLQDEERVLSSVQILRQQADQAGNLQNMNNVNVVRETKTIIIESRQPDIIYVPYYDTRVVYGDWRWSHYPPIFWQHPVHYVSHHGPYYWHNPVHLTVGLFFGAVHWNNRHVVVQHHKSRYYKNHGKKKTSTSYQSKRWQHNPRHRKGVAYRTSSTQKKYRSQTPSAQQHKVLRANQRHFVNKNKHTAQHASNRYNSSKSQSLKHKLQVNRAEKIDQNKANKHSFTRQEPYGNKNWRPTKDSRKVDHNKIKTSPKRYDQKHKEFRTNEKNVSQKQSEQVFTSRDKKVKSYSKPVRTPNSTVQKRHNSNRVQSEKGVRKHSNTNVANRQQSSGSRTHQSRAKQHN
tara:strand:+ start:2769 stop:4172 length:1404 start_codon:yes stop_codon:yes gene_type:complete